MIKNYIVYKITDLTNNKVYIGKTTTQLKKRWSVHLAHAKYFERYKEAGKTYLHAAMRKHGTENFIIKEIDRALNDKHLFWLENFYIEYFNAINPKYGYNLILDKYDNGVFDRTLSNDSLAKIIHNSHKKGKNKGVYLDKERSTWNVRIKKGDLLVFKRFNSYGEAAIISDKIRILFYDDSIEDLIYPEKIQEYLTEDLQKLYEGLVHQEPKKSLYNGVTLNKNNTFLVRWRNKNLCFGSYKTEKEAAEVFDKCYFYLTGKIDKLNFPKNLIIYKIEDLEEFYEGVLNKISEGNKLNRKSSKYKHICKHNKKWRFIITIHNKKMNSTVYETEEEAYQALQIYLTQQQTSDLSVK